MKPLAERRDFVLGAWRVSPSLLEARIGDEVHRLEPKVMEVLAALAEAPNETCSRDALLAAVWPGRAVTDDALTRCVSQLRRLFRAHVEGGVDLKTIPRVGYVLRVEPTASRGDRDEAEAAARPAVGRARALWVKWRRVAALTVFLLITVVIVYIRSGAPGAGGRIREVRPLIVTPAVELDPALSPSGGEVAFARASRLGGAYDLSVHSITGRHELRLTESAARDRHPAWSPDGGRIAFFRESPHGECGVHVISSLGGAARALAPCGAAHGQSLDWSPDGRLLAMTVRDGALSPGRLRLFDLDAMQYRSVNDIRSAFPAYYAFEDARFDRSGRLLAFTAASALGSEDIYRYEFDSGRLTRLTNDGLKIHGLDWEADAPSVIYSSNRGGAFALWRTQARAQPPEPVPLSVGADAPSVAQRAIVFEKFEQDSDLQRVGLKGDEAPAPFLQSPRFEWGAQMSPDGARIAFLSDRSGAAEIWVAERDGENVRQLTAFGGAYLHSPRWAPDGGSIIFAAPVNGGFDLYRIGLDGGAPERLTQAPGDEFAPRFAADGASVLYGARNEEGWRIERLDLASGRSSSVAGALGGMAAQESEDGARIYFVKSDAAGLWVVDSGGDGRLVMSELQPVDWANWAVLGEEIYYVARADGAAPSLKSLDIATGETRLIRDLENFYYKSGLSIDLARGAFLYSTIRIETVDLYMLERER